MHIPPFSHFQVLIGSSTMPWGCDIDVEQVLTVQGLLVECGDRRRTGR